jgi:DNA replication and repair protein RecF
MIHRDLHVWVSDVQVQNLRCHKEHHWVLRSGVNIFVGENGCGKTSVLEAVYLMAHGRSFRQTKDPELIRWQQSHMNVCGTWHRYGPLHVKIHAQKRKVEVLLQGRKLAKRKELMETLPVIVDAPQGKKLVDGVNNERRKWLDQLLMVCEPSIRSHYQGYLRALMQRTRVLRKYGDNEELSVWESQMVLYGRKIKQYRDEICKLINAFLEDEKQFTEAHLSLYIGSQVPEIDEQWCELLKNNRVQDKRMGRCRVGPHSDKLHIYFNGKEIRTVGSRGQQKLAGIALKLAECGVRQQYRQIWPALLLDDCFEALDDKRRKTLVDRLCKYPGQVLATAPNIEKSIVNDSVSVWKVLQSSAKNNMVSMLRHETMEKIA